MWGSFDVWPLCGVGVLDWGAGGGLNAEQPRQLGDDLLLVKFSESDVKAQIDAPKPDGADDMVGRTPTELFCELESDGFCAF